MNPHPKNTEAQQAAVASEQLRVSPPPTPRIPGIGHPKAKAKAAQRTWMMSSAAGRAFSKKSPEEKSSLRCGAVVVGAGNKAVGYEGSGGRGTWGGARSTLYTAGAGRWAESRGARGRHTGKGGRSI